MIFLGGGGMGNLQGAFSSLNIYLFFILVPPPILILLGFLIRKKNKEMAKPFFIFAFLIPLISFGMCFS